MIDRNTKWLEVTELDDISASVVVSAFLRTWVTRYGVPVTVDVNLLESCGPQCVRNYTFPTGPGPAIIRSQTG